MKPNKKIKRTVVQKYDYPYYKSTDVVFITISPPNRAESVGTLVGQDYIDIYRIIKRFNKAYCRGQKSDYIITYMIYPELSQQGRLHYHGIMNIPRMLLQPMISSFTRNIGFTKIDPITSFIGHLRTIIYCQKQYADFKSSYITLFNVENIEPLYNHGHMKKKFIKMIKQKNIIDYFIK